jgi:RimJ/RimL family protein N-acetyltransferase
MVPYAFNTLGMQPIEIVIAAGNTASEAVARKYGAQFECNARNRLQLRGIPVSAAIFSVIP